MAKNKLKTKIIKGSIVSITLGAISYGLSTLGMTPFYYTLAVIGIFFIWEVFIEPIVKIENY